MAAGKPIPIILGDDGGKMSKRHGSTSVGAYRENGFLPEALFNYLTRVGWACGDMEHFTAEEAIAVFGLDGVAKTGAKWDMDKLTWLNQQWIMGLSPETLAERALPYFEAIGVQTDDFSNAGASLDHGPGPCQDGCLSSSMSPSWERPQRRTTSPPTTAMTTCLGRGRDQEVPQGRDRTAADGTRRHARGRARVDRGGPRAAREGLR